MKGYPKSKFEIVNQSQINNIEVVTPTDPIPLVMATYTSDKGTEDWEVLTSFNDFTKNHGGLNFARHGQAQLTVIEALRSGAYVLAKRLVSDNATLANASIRARIIKVGDVSYVYLYSKSVEGASNAEEVYQEILGDFDYDATTATEITLPSNIPSEPAIVLEGDESTGTDDGPREEEPVVDPGISATTIDIPLFTVVAAGRGESKISFRLIPEYVASKSNNYLKYTLEVAEDSSVLDSVICSLNPDVSYDNKNQSLETKVNAVSKNVQSKLYETAIYKLAAELAKTAKIGEDSIAVTDLMNMDMLNGLDRKGKTNITGIVSGDNTTDGSLWTQYIPADIQDSVVNLQGEVGVALTNGSYGTLGFDPSKNPVELENLLLGAWGAAGVNHKQFDPIIYDLDKYKIDVVFDANFPMTVKNAIINVMDFRGDAVFLADLGTDNLTTIDAIISKKNGNDNTYPITPGIQHSKFVTVYHNYFKIVSPYNNKQIEVTMPYLLISRLLMQFDNGLGRPFAGIANQLTFPEIISKSVNFLPVVIPGEDQKQRLVDENINYISYYDETAVMETMYTNDDEYSQLSFLHNIMSIQEVVKALRTRCPKIRYTFIDGSDLDKYIDDCNTVINNYTSNFKSIEMTYMQDEKYEQNNIFYAVLKVTFKKFVQEEYFKVIALS